MSSLRSTIAAAASVVLIGAGALAGCGDSSSQSATTTPPAATTIALAAGKAGEPRQITCVGTCCRLNPKDACMTAPLPSCPRPSFAALRGDAAAVAEYNRTAPPNCRRRGR